MNTQPPPIHTAERPTVDEVIEDLKVRKAMGIKKYGVPLQPSNGRDSLQDAYEEVLDLTLYVKNEIRRRDGVADMIASARAANKAMYERILRLEADADAQARRHVETIQALRRELAGVMPDEPVINFHE